MIPQLCHVCGSAAAHTCRFCGRPTCGNHFEAAKGACAPCARGVRA